ncbi:proton-conducting transporter membrane subunit [Leptospira licerasiae]|uniref:NADH-ubiquinone/plastoquinone complex I subunit n=1 Tax=Leptospira licerasiae str. MMD4847 TaxID=1049971 RepID=A0ABN0HA19_9LEPT|nr:proton-conducting transporter membrane subunit [Leptospira licerasiae]EIE01780.1 NADH-ubiquinone/plastoquinone complex I subunit [Leptospira licerasiae serovar Varillal str. VAR 010]EJZ42469.1 NADH-ubiquinone/plastoquinone complex I subunit [Leptospira licerasiae str. MMD4847]
MTVLAYLSVITSLLAPFLIGNVLGVDFFGKDSSIGLGLSLQAILGSFIAVYVYGYEKERKALVIFGYAIFFLSTGICYLVGKSLWLILFWELSTISAFLLYIGGKWNDASIRSFVALVAAGGIGAFCFTFWIFSNDPRSGLFFLILGLLIKSAFFGVHFWLPEAHAGAPAHASAAYSGLLVNLPLVLFSKFALPLLPGTYYAAVLIPLAGIGVLWAGITALFSREVKKSIAYSTVENMNFLWLSLLLSAYWQASEQESLRMLSKAFAVLFLISLVHHSISKTFQFLFFGYLTKLSGRSGADENTGIGRISGIPTFLAAIGTMSFLAIPGTTGFLSESTFIKLLSAVLEVADTSAALVLPLLILVCTGLAVGAAAHLKLFLGLVLSRPRTNFEDHGKNTTISVSLFLTGALVLISPLIILSLTNYYAVRVEWLDFSWFRGIGILNVIGLVILLSVGLLGLRHKIKERKLWDCGGLFGGSEVAITSSALSDPLAAPLGRYFADKAGNSRLDKGFIKILLRILSSLKAKIRGADDESISVDLTYSSFTVLSILIVIIIVRLAEGDIWSQLLSYLAF